MEPLSSRLTWFMKYLVPASFFAGIALGLPQLLVQIIRHQPIDAPLALGWLFFLVAGAWFVHQSRLLWTAALDGPELVLWSRRELLRIPLSYILGVATHPLVPNLVEIRFRGPTAAGERVWFLSRQKGIFFPKYRWAASRLREAMREVDSPSPPRP